MDVIYSKYPYKMAEEMENGENIKQEICCNYKGTPLRMQREKLGGYRIVQILSTNPHDFMKKNICPGMVLNEVKYQRK